MNAVDDPRVPTLTEVIAWPPPARPRHDVPTLYEAIEVQPPAAPDRPDAQPDDALIDLADPPGPPHTEPAAAAEPSAAPWPGVPADEAAVLPLEGLPPQGPHEGPHEGPLALLVGVPAGVPDDPQPDPRPDPVPDVSAAAPPGVSPAAPATELDDLAQAIARRVEHELAAWVEQRLRQALPDLLTAAVQRAAADALASATRDAVDRTVGELLGQLREELPGQVRVLLDQAAAGAPGQDPRQP